VDDDVYGKQMAPMAMTLVDDTAVNNVAAYIEGLPEHPSESTVKGNISKGKALYITCGTCHGKDGRGVWNLNAPRLAGMSDWYLVRQLHNFQKGIRGGQPGDGHGKQMVLISVMLPSEQDINDVVAYINTL